MIFLFAFIFVCILMLVLVCVLLAIQILPSIHHRYLAKGERERDRETLYVVGHTA